VCCRFIDNETPLGPTDISLIPYKDRFVCSRFNPAANRCKDYENRPLDCRIYPFVVMWDEEYKNIVLGVDHKCPHSKYVMPAKAGIHSFILDSRLPPSGTSRGNDSVAKYISRFQDDVEVLGELDIKAEPVLNKLLIGDKALFEKYASRGNRPVSGYSFIANYVWTGLLDYYWAIIDDNFCLFCRTRDTIFMPLPPLGKRLSEKAVKECFKLMNKGNKNKKCSRIEEVTQGNAGNFKDLGYEVREKGCEYIYRQKDLAGLTGDKYKAKRALCNYFNKNYRFEFREFKPDDKKACLELFRRWAKERIKKGTVLTENCPQADGDYYKALIEDSYLAHKKAMDRFQDLGLAGRLIIIDNKVSSYTFGYWLDDKTLVVLFEIADLRVKGLPQFIFMKFCSEAPGAELVNAMDDSGLASLKQVKMSYHPIKIERTYCVYEPSPSYGGRLGEQEGLGE